MDWSIVQTPVCEPQMIMDKDKTLLEALALDPKPVLHLYEFAEKSATYGHFLDPASVFDMEALASEGIRLGRRPTGGGVIFHIWDFAFSVLIPSFHPGFSQNTLSNYALVNRAVLLAIQDFLQVEGLALVPTDGELLGRGCEHFCMAKPTRYDVVLGEKKVAGAAQRKTKHGLLHQGSISLMMPSLELLESILLPGLSVLEGMKAFTFPILSGNPSLEDRNLARQKIKEILKKHITKI